MLGHVLDVVSPPAAAAATIPLVAMTDMAVALVQELVAADRTRPVTCVICRPGVTMAAGYFSSRGRVGDRVLALGDALMHGTELLRWLQLVRRHDTRGRPAPTLAALPEQWALVGIVMEALAAAHPDRLPEFFGLCTQLSRTAFALGPPLCWSCARTHY